MPGVSVVRLPNADVENTFVRFSEGKSVTNGYTVTFKVNGENYAIVQAQAGQVVNRPTTPTTAEKYFSGCTNLTSAPELPATTPDLSAAILPARKAA